MGFLLWAMLPAISTGALAFAPIAPLLAGQSRSLPSPTSSPLPAAAQCRRPLVVAATRSNSDGASDEAFAQSPPSSSLDPRAAELKNRLLSLSAATDNGFDATRAQRDEARGAVFELARYNPTEEPAYPYYEGASSSSGDGPTLTGKWKLIYTDAPDITGLGAAGPLSTAQLGRIGQECTPPLIKNVIEWRRPDWLPEGLPLSGTAEGRVLQKICTRGRSRPGSPKVVELSVEGLDLAGDDGAASSSGIDEDSGGFGLSGLLGGGPASFFAANPLELRGPLSGQIPFGQFEILYLDEEMRVIKTGQNYLAVNVRLGKGEEWF